MAQRILYNPGQLTPEPPQDDESRRDMTAERPAPEEPIEPQLGQVMPEEAEHAGDRQADILDQLMLDRAVQEPQHETVDKTPEYISWAGEAHLHIPHRSMYGAVGRSLMWGRQCGRHHQECPQSRCLGGRQSPGISKNACHSDTHQSGSFAGLLL